MTQPIGLHAMIAQAAKANGIPPGLAAALVHQESGGNPNARSPVGAMGLTQLMPATARGLGVRDPADPMQNLMGGMRYLADQYHKFGSWDLALAAYNAGPGAVAKYGGIPPYAETQAYVKNIMAAAGNPQSSSLPGSPQPSPSPQPQAVAPQALDLSSLLQPSIDPTQTSTDPLASSPTLGAVQQGGGDMTQQLLQQEVNSPIPMPTASTPPTPVPGAPMSPPVNQHKGIGGIAKTALSQVGIAYKWGGAPGLGHQTDCSGLLQESAAANGVQLGRTTYEQWKQGTPVSLKSLKPGDAVFSEPTSQGPGHVSIYIGHGQVVEDPHTGASVSVSTLAGRRGIVGARRYG